MQKTKIIRLPLTEKDVRFLKAGDAVSINGMLVTGRDNLHTFLYTEKPRRRDIPVHLEGTIMYHCRPITERRNGGFTVVAAGPTTSMRVEPYESVIIAEYRIRGVMGKGGMGKKTLKAMQKYGCVYFHAIGGAAVYLAERIKTVVGVWKLNEFGMAEAMWILDVEDFPAIVTMDAHGRSIHEEIEKMSRQRLDTLLDLS